MDLLERFRSETSEIFGAFVATGGWALTWHDWSEVLRIGGICVVDPAYGQHFTAFCQGVKAAGRNLDCRRCDLELARAACAADPAVRVRRCHAGADEFHVPVHHRGALVGVAYLGQFRRRDDQPGALPLVDEPWLARGRDLARLLQGWLHDLCRRVEAAKHNAGADRATRIRVYLEQHPEGDLPGLARELGLSVTRTGHAVRECTGSPFTQLRESLRLERAQRLLATTDRPIAVIAAAVGLPDANYFARCFRRRVGCTPGVWRARERRRLEA